MGKDWTNWDEKSKYHRGGRDESYCLILTLKRAKHQGGFRKEERRQLREPREKEEERTGV